MTKLPASVLTALLIATPALADKPEHAGKTKHSPEQAEAHQAAMEAKASEGQANAEEYRHTAAEKRAEAKDKAITAEEKHYNAEDKRKGLEEQKEKKAEQARKEMGKGSEKGQAAREEHSKKWWQFWKD